MRERVPPGQSVTEEFPALHIGKVPSFDESKWTLRAEGSVRRKLLLTRRRFLELPRVAVGSDFHCVTGWSRLDNEWEGVRFSVLAGLVGPREEVESVLFTSDDGYSISLPLGVLMDQEVLLAAVSREGDLQPSKEVPFAWWCRVSTRIRAPSG